MKAIIGIFSRVSNDEPEKIKQLWEQFRAGHIKDEIIDTKSDDVFCVYTEYSGDYTQPYTMVIGYEVRGEPPIPSGFKRVEIPDHDYTTYAVSGPMPESIVKKWQSIYDNKKPRAYDTDFDRYTSEEKAEVNVEYK